MSPLTCAEVEDLAPELALGTLPGDQRATVLAHLDGCGDCRHLVNSLSDTADALLLLAPEVDPPAGFTHRVMGRLTPVRSRRWRPVAVAAAVALLIGLAAGYVPGHVRSGSVAVVQVASFVHTGGESVAGQVYARSDNPPWVFMTVRDAGSGDAYTCELVLKDGTTLPIGSFKMHSGTGSWGRSVDVALDQLRSVQLRDANGSLAATAALKLG